MLNYETCFPWSNAHELNLDWVLEEMKSLSRRIEVLEQADDISKQYTDEQVAIALATMRGELASVKKALENNISDVARDLRVEISILARRIEDVQKSIVPLIESRIEQNNQLIYKAIDNAILNTTVTDYFTGQEVSLQSFLNTLAQFHLSNPMTYTEYKDKNVTYNKLASLSINYIELANNGKNLVHN